MRTGIIVTVGLAALAILTPGASARGVDLSQAAGLYEVSLSRGATVLDYDADGWEDLLIGRHYAGFPRLYRNDRSGGFQEITDYAFPAGERGIRDAHECAAADVNLDARVDLYCTTGGEHGLGHNPNRLWIQQSDGRFSEETASYGVGNPWGRGRRATFLDANGDAYPDLYVGNAFPRRDGRRSANRLYLNDQGRKFQSARLGVNREVGADSLQALDYDRDGREDIFLCGKNGVHIYRNLGESGFREVTLELRASMSCQSALLGNLNGDGRPDLIRVTRSSLRVHLFGRGGFRKPRYRLRLAGGREVALGRINGDDRPDIYFLRSGKPDHDAPDLALVNRRGGRAFKRVPVPPSRQGVGESVEAIDYDNDGFTEFLVANGHREWPGPIRLIGFR